MPNPNPYPMPWNKMTDIFVADWPSGRRGKCVATFGACTLTPIVWQRRTSSPQTLSTTWAPSRAQSRTKPASPPPIGLVLSLRTPSLELSNTVLAHLAGFCPLLTPVQYKSLVLKTVPKSLFLSQLWTVDYSTLKLKRLVKYKLKYVLIILSTSKQKVSTPQVSLQSNLLVDQIYFSTDKWLAKHKETRSS